MGSVFSVDVPIETNEFGYKPVKLQFSLNPSLGRHNYDDTKFNFLPGGYLLGLSFIGFSQSSWNGNPHLIQN